MNDREIAEREARYALEMLRQSQDWFGPASITLGWKARSLRRAVDALHIAHQYAVKALNLALQEQDWQCPECHGVGVVTNYEPGVALELDKVCPACKGSGEVDTHPDCPECEGHGLVEVLVSASDPAALEERMCPKCEGRGK